MRDEIRKIVEECATEAANRVANLIEGRLQAAMAVNSEPVRKATKGRKAKATPATGIKIPTFTTGGDTKRKYTKSAKAIEASRGNIAKAREARLAKIHAEKAVETPAPVAAAPEAATA